MYDKKGYYRDCSNEDFRSAREIEEKKGAGGGGNER